MGKELKKDDFGYLGEDFQYRLAKVFIEEPRFFGELSTIVNQNAFTESILRVFVGALKDYYAKENVVPSYETIGTVLKSRAKTNNEVEEYDELIKKLKRESLEGCNVVKDTAVKFFKQQNLIYVANKILQIAGTGNIERFDECQKLLDDASLAGQEDEFGFSPFDLEDKALSKQFKVPIPTGVEKLDQVLNGGLEKKKVGVIIGSAGFGKSTFSTAIASYASTYKCDLNGNEGYKVLQIYFEDDDVDIARKHFSRIATQESGQDIEARDLTKSEADITEIRRVLDNYPDKETMNKNLRLKPFLAHTKSASDIEIFLKRLINTGFKPDLVIIDYFECLTAEKGGFSSDSEWTRQANTMRKIENIAKELDIAIWVPTQGNKDSITSPDIVTMDQAGGSIVKVQAASVIISIARSVPMQAQNKANLAVLKNRGGISGVVWNNIKFNNGTSTISCDEVIEYNDMMAWKDEEAKQKERERIDMTRQIAEKMYKRQHPEKQDVKENDDDMKNVVSSSFSGSTTTDTSGRTNQFDVSNLKPLEDFEL